MKTNAISASAAFGVLISLSSHAQDATPRHIDELGRAGFLASASGTAPEMTAVAGARFMELVPDSKREVCRILLEHLAKRNRGLYRLRIVDQQGSRIAACEL